MQLRVRKYPTPPEKFYNLGVGRCGVRGFRTPSCKLPIRKPATQGEGFPHPKLRQFSRGFRTPSCKLPNRKPATRGFRTPSPPSEGRRRAVNGARGWAQRPPERDLPPKPHPPLRFAPFRAHRRAIGTIFSLPFFATTPSPTCFTYRRMSVRRGTSERGCSACFEAENRTYCTSVRASQGKAERRAGGRPGVD